MFIYCSFCTPNIIHTHFYRQNAVVGVHREEIPAMDSTLAYSHCWDLRDVQLMLRYHNKKEAKVQTSASGNTPLICINQGESFISSAC